VRDAATVASIADGVIIGSSLIERIAAARTGQAAVAAVRRYCEELAAVM
jgi:tryptophan synthase alpha subunit